MENNVAALETRLNSQNKKIESLEKQPKESIPSIRLSEVTLEVAKESPGLEKLATKVIRLEAERTILLKELAKLSDESLLPGSELGKLLNQLNSNSKEKQEQALQGLFKLKDPRSLNTLVNYFYSHSEDTTIIHHLAIYDWLDLVWELDWKVGIDFASKLLESQDTFWSNAAYRQLRQEVDNLELIEEAEKSLEIVALTSTSTLGRTQAKLLLKEYSTAREKLKNNETLDNRSMKRVILDIEKDVKSLIPTEEK